jgi:hypothetical protein
MILFNYILDGKIPTQFKIKNRLEKNTNEQNW